MAQFAHTIGSMSVEEFEIYPTPEGKAELVRGELQLMPPPGARHGALAVALGARLHIHAATNGLGRVFSNAGFVLLDLPRTVRAPDLSFVRTDRLPPGGIGPGLLRMAPDLAVEIVSPSETTSRLAEKLDDYRAARVPLVWVFYPDRRLIQIITDGGPPRSLGTDDVLDGGATVPGFSCPVGELLQGLEGTS